MLLNRVRCEAMEKIRVYFDRNLCRFLPPKESIFLICDQRLVFSLLVQELSIVRRLLDIPFN